MILFVFCSYFARILSELWLDFIEVLCVFCYDFAYILSGLHSIFARLLSDLFAKLTASLAKKQTA